MFKEASEKKLVTYEGDPTKLSAHFLEEIYKPQKSGLYVKKAERKKKLPSNNTISGKTIFEK